MFHFGFSYIGALYLMMLFIPNLAWAKHQPKGYSADGENQILVAFERAGEVLCTCCALVFLEFNIRKTIWIVWLVLSFVLMILYEIYWLRYFKSKRNLEDFYKPMFGIKVPGATLPVIAFFLLGIYGTNIFMIISSLILGIGHIGIHMQHYNRLNPKKPKRMIRIIKNTIIIILCLIMSVNVFFIGARNINYLNHYQMIHQGVDEGLYIDIGDLKQYVLIRGENKNNPVIIFLHGGPSSPESYVNYSWVNDLVSDYTVIDWDQRGCGRTYEYNKNKDPNNEKVTYPQALSDLDELVNYARKRFHQEKVIIVGHSYGTVLATNYIEQHPEKVAQYIGIAQVVSMNISNQIMVEKALEKTSSKKDVQIINETYQDYLNQPCVSTTMTLRQKIESYLPKSLPEKSLWYALTSPYMSMEDFKWFTKQLKPLDEYLKMNQNLFDSLMDYNLYNVKMPSNVPINFISGSKDYICPEQSIKDYIGKTHNGTLYSIKECGHNVQYTKPYKVSQSIKSILKKA